MATDTGGPAFPKLLPITVWDGEEHVPRPEKGYYDCTSGMTLLDWFAGQATLEDIAFQMNEQTKTLPEARYDHGEAMIAEKRRREEKGLEEGPNEKRAE